MTGARVTSPPTTRCALIIAIESMLVVGIVATAVAELSLSDELMARVSVADSKAFRLAEQA